MNAYGTKAKCCDKLSDGKLYSCLFHDSLVAKLSDFSLRKDKCTLEFPPFFSQKVS